VLRKRQLTFKGLHAVISQKIKVYRKTNNFPWLFLQEELFVLYLLFFPTAHHLGEKMVELMDIWLSRSEYFGLKFKKYLFLSVRKSAELLLISLSPFVRQNP
jgi:hypothetical protein